MCFFFALAACGEVGDIVRVARKAVVDSVYLTGVGGLERKGPGCVWISTGNAWLEAWFTGFVELQWSVLTC